MRRIAMVILLVFALVGVAAGRGPVLAYSVQVTNAYDGSSGSGVLVAQGILTAHHVVQTEDGQLAPELVCRTSTGQTLVGVPLRIDSDNDLALLAVVPVLTGVRMGAEPSLGDPIWVVGCGFQVAHSVKRGVVSNREPGRLLLDAMVLPGDSGCAVLNDRGELVGMVRAVYHSSAITGYGVAVDLATIQAFLGPPALNGIRNNI